jgi:cyclopropane-fatty-acyl-phospholipid synthase
VSAGTLRYMLLDHALGSDLLPDGALKLGSRLGIHKRLRAEERGGVEAQEERTQDLVQRMSSGPIAELPARANEQHYEMPPECSS